MTRSPMCWPQASSSSVGKGPGADTRGIGLDDTQNVAEIARTDAREPAAAPPEVVVDEVT